MKYSSIIILVFVTATFSSCAQEKHEHKSEQKSKTKAFSNTNVDVKNQVSNVLTAYYQIKDALVADNDAAASQAAKEFRKNLESIDMKKMSSEEHAYYMPLSEKLDYDAEHIAGSPNIEHMREHFTSFSENMYSLIKAFKPENISVYQMHCPMYDKGANWLSNEEKVKNPYFGKKMLTCGKVTETIN